MTKIAISLPEELLQGIERERIEHGVTRSQFVRHAVEAYLRRERERADVERYVRSYQEQPETPQEVAEAEALYRAGLAAWADLPWEETKSK